MEIVLSTLCDAFSKSYRGIVTIWLKTLGKVNAKMVVETGRFHKKGGRSTSSPPDGCAALPQSNR